MAATSRVGVSKSHRLRVREFVEKRLSHKIQKKNFQENFLKKSSEKMTKKMTKKMTEKNALERTKKIMKKCRPVERFFHKKIMKF